MPLSIEALQNQAVKSFGRKHVIKDGFHQARFLILVANVSTSNM